MSLQVSIKALDVKGLDELREEFGRRYGPPPKLRSKDLLRSVLAWRMQADAYGDLDGETIKLLNEVKLPRAPVAPAGSRISREWRGVRHEVEIVAEGFLYDGKRWKSLSEIARAITGTRWNGPRFFGLREERP